MLFKKLRSLNAKAGQLSKTDIIKELNEDKGISIYSCVDFSRNIHAASFDITPTIVCMSVKSGMLQTVYVKNSPTVNSYYVFVKPHDTLLIVSNEFISLSNYISGYVTSRVSNVVNGFGHICTTIDPNWRGALLIALSNPSNRTIKIDVGTSTKFFNDKEKFIFDKKPLATLTFHYLSEKSIEQNKEYNSMRTDLLNEISYKKRTGLKNFVRKIFHPNQKKFTDFFFEYLKFHEDEMKTKDGWKQFLREFSIFNNIKNPTPKNNAYGRCAYDFIIKENFLNRTKHFLENHKVTIVVILSIIFFIIYKSYLSDSELLSAIFEILKLV